ncbi:MAG: hypothetical protein ACRYFZ_18190 [Janthinobacterium lividum]
MLRLYTTSPTTLQLAALGITGQLAQRVQVLPLSALPAPLPARAASLRLEQAALQQIERTIRWTLSQYAEHRRLPDACREADLRSDLDVTLWQLERVGATLRALAPERPAA